MLQSHWNGRFESKPFPSLRTCSLRTCFHEAFIFPALGKWRERLRARARISHHPQDNARGLLCHTSVLSEIAGTQSWVLLCLNCLCTCDRQANIHSSSSFFLLLIVRLHSGDSYDDSGLQEWNLMSTMKSPSNLKKSSAHYPLALFWTLTHPSARAEMKRGQGMQKCCAKWISSWGGD